MLCCVTPPRIIGEIRRSGHQVVYAAPGLTSGVAEALLQFKRLGGCLQVVVDCGDEVCRLGYGEIEAVRLLIDHGVDVRRSPGLRVGILICDNRAWTFAPTVLCVESYPQSDETPNGVELSCGEAERLFAHICPSPKPQGSLLPTAEVGSEPVTFGDLALAEASLEVAPPIKFETSRLVRVFQPYIRYVEISLQGCAVQNQTISLPNDLVLLVTDEQIRRRIRTSFRLLPEGSELSDSVLKKKLDTIRDLYTASIPAAGGRVMLRYKQAEFEAEIKGFRGELTAHQELVKASIAGQMIKSITQIVDAMMPGTMANPPAKLRAQLPTDKPNENQARQWLTCEVGQHFPKAEKIVGEMKLNVTYKDVTYETLNEAELGKALKKAFTAVEWDKPLTEFNAAKERGTETKR